MLIYERKKVSKLAVKYVVNTPFYKLFSSNSLTIFESKKAANYLL